MARCTGAAARLPGDSRLGINYLVLCVTMALVLIRCRPVAANSFNFPPSDFDILGADSGRLIGRGHYTLDESAGAITLHGENRYFDGQYDIEEDKLKSPGVGLAPKLLTFRHDFFDAGGSPSIAARLDVETGLGVCGKAEGGGLELTDEQFDFPDDTYAGASVLLPIQRLVGRGEGEMLRLHVFNCAPTPKLIAVDVKPPPKSQTWAEYPGELEKVDVKPNLGFWTVVIQPFIPKLAAWFDPSQGALLVGAQLQRYYKGPKIILVRRRQAQIGKDANQDKAPSLGPEPSSSGR